MVGSVLLLMFLTRFDALNGTWILEAINDSKNATVIHNEKYGMALL